MGYSMETGGESFHHPPPAMATTLCFAAPSAGFDNTTSFIVQVVGIDADGAGTYHSSIKSAFEYATQANGNGFDCFVHLA